MNVLVTGAAGFIGANLVMRLLKTEEDINIVGFDSLNDYYDESLKEYRLKQIVELAKVPELVERPLYFLSAFRQAQRPWLILLSLSDGILSVKHRNSHLCYQDRQG